MVLGWPGGDTDALHAAPNHVRMFASSIDTAFNTANAKVLSQLGSWQGQSAQAVRSSWGENVKESANYAAKCRELAQALDDLADQIHDQRVAYVAAIATMTATAFVGVALTIFSFGASDAAAAAAEAAESAAVAAILDAVATALESFVGKMALNFVIGAAVDASTQGAIIGAEEVFDKNRKDVADFSISEMLISGGTFVALGKADELTQGLSRTTRMLTMLTVGGAGGFLTEGSGELIKDGKINPEDLVVATLLGAAGGFVGKEDDRIFALHGAKGTIKMTDDFAKSIADHKHVTILVKEGRNPKISPELQKQIDLGHVDIRSIPGPKRGRIVDGTEVTPDQVRQWASAGKHITVVAPKNSAEAFKQALSSDIDNGTVTIKTVARNPIPAGAR